MLTLTACLWEVSVWIWRKEVSMSTVVLDRVIRDPKTPLNPKDAFLPGSLHLWFVPGFYYNHYNALLLPVDEQLTDI